MRKIVLPVFVLFAVLVVVLPSVSAQEFGCAVPAPKKLVWSVYLLNEYPEHIDLKYYDIDQPWSGGYFLSGEDFVIDLKKRIFTLKAKKITALPRVSAEIILKPSLPMSASFETSWRMIVVKEEDRASHTHETYVTVYGLKDNTYQLILPRTKESK